MIYDSDGTPIAEIKTDKLKWKLATIVEQSTSAMDKMMPLMKKGGILKITPEVEVYAILKHIKEITKEIQSELRL